jgi:hypothetical protein
VVIGVISDTHGLLRPEAVAALRGVGHILHAGDVGAPEVLAALRAVAPVTAVRGNNDRAAWTRSLPVSATVVLDGARILLLHDLSELDVDPPAEGIAAVVAGHSHRPRREIRGGVLYFNPGSAGPRRFQLPVAIGKLAVDAGRVAGEIVLLPVASG